MTNRVEAASAAFTEAMASGEWDRCAAILVDAIAACASAAELDELLHAGGIEEVVLADSTLDASLADAIAARAMTLADPADGALVLGWLGALSGFSPGALFSRAPLTPSREALRGGVAGHLELLRAWSNDPAPQRRAAAAWVLAFCPSATPEDAGALAARAREESDAEALATQLLSAGVISGRHVAQAAAVGDGAARGLGHERPLVRLCAAAALAWSGEALPTAAVATIAEHLATPVAFPAAWAPGRRNTLAAAAELLAWMKVTHPEEALLALLASCDAAIAAAPGRAPPPWMNANIPPELAGELGKIALAPIPRGARSLVADRLVRLAFEERGRPIGDAGVAIDDLDPLQRRTFEVIDRLQAPIRSLHLLDGGAVHALVCGDALHTRPLELTVEGHPRRWPFARLLGAVGTGEVEVAAARDVVLRLPDAEAADLASRWSPGRVWLEQRIRDADARDRMLSLCLAILEALRARGFDVDALGKASLADRAPSSPDVGILAIDALRVHGAALPEDLLPLLVRAVAQGWWKERLSAAIAAQPAELRGRLAARAR